MRHVNQFDFAALSYCTIATFGLLDITYRLRKRVENYGGFIVKEEGGGGRRAEGGGKNQSSPIRGRGGGN